MLHRNLFRYAGSKLFIYLMAINQITNEIVVVDINNELWLQIALKYSGVLNIIRRKWILSWFIAS